MKYYTPFMMFSISLLFLLAAAGRAFIPIPPSDVFPDPTPLLYFAIFNLIIAIPLLVYFLHHSNKLTGIPAGWFMGGAIATTISWLGYKFAGFEKVTALQFLIISFGVGTFGLVLFLAILAQKVEKMSSPYKTPSSKNDGEEEK